MRYVVSGLCAALVCGAAAPAQEVGRRSSPLPALRANPAGRTPDFREYATVEARTDGVGVYSFSNLMYVFGQSPDLNPGAILQDGNANLIAKLKLKRSWEITHNWCGSSHEMTPKTPWNDVQAFLPIHLIDGDPDTVWSSWGCHAPNGRTEWIRIDLPYEQNVGSVALVCSKDFGMGAFGKALPKTLEVRLSRDAVAWDTVCSTRDFVGHPSGRTVIHFKPRPVKQVMVLAGDLTKLGKYKQMGYIFSIGELEVLDGDGSNVGLLSRGAGVTVSSRAVSHDNDRITQDALWAPLQFDMGLKWVRFGHDNGAPMWAYTEHEKGKLEVDRRVDESVDEIVRGGVNVIMVLDLKGNWLYEDPPRKTDWETARFRELNIMYDDGPQGALSSEKMFQGYLHYVDYMVRHFKGRVAYYEIGNEWNTHTTVDEYLTAFYRILPVIKKADPGAKVINGSFMGFYPGIISVLGPGSGVEGGKLIARGPVVLRAEHAGRLKDGVVEVDVESSSPVGVVLRGGDPEGTRYSGRLDSNDMVLAIYDPQNEEIRFQDIVCRAGWRTVVGSHTNYRSVKPAKGLGEVVHLSARIEGSTATLTVSSGLGEVTATHEVRRNYATLHRAAFAGIYHWPNPDQPQDASAEFDNVTIKRPGGKVVLVDRFDEADDRGKPDGWVPFIGHWHKWSLAPLLDGFAWHGSYESWTQQDFRRSLLRFKRHVSELGVKGPCLVTEIYTGASYPQSPHAQQTSERHMANRLAVITARHSALDIETGPCHPHFSGFPHPQSLCRQPVPCETVIPLQPKMAYYMYRNMATVLDDCWQADFEVRFSGDEAVEWYPMRHRGSGDRVLTAWLKDASLADETVDEATADVTIVGVRAREAWGYDIANGTEQALVIRHDGNDTVIPRLRIKEYPVYLRVGQ